MAANSDNSSGRLLGDIPLQGQIGEKERIRYIVHLMFFIGCGLFAFGIWALSGFTNAAGQGGPFPF